MGPWGGFFARATLGESEGGGGGGGGEDAPVSDEDVGRVEETEEAGVVDDLVSNEHVEILGVGGDVGKQRAEDERGDTDWRRISGHTRGWQDTHGRRRRRARRRHSLGVARPLRGRGRGGGRRTARTRRARRASGCRTRRRS